jgi:hypothetical protein
MKGQIKLFEEKRVRTAWDETTEEWYFSVDNVIEILTFGMYHIHLQLFEFLNKTSDSYLDKWYLIT